MMSSIVLTLLSIGDMRLHACVWVLYIGMASAIDGQYLMERCQAGLPFVQAWLQAWPGTVTVASVADRAHAACVSSFQSRGAGDVPPTLKEVHAFVADVFAQKERVYGPPAPWTPETLGLWQQHLASQHAAALPVVHATWNMFLASLQGQEAPLRDATQVLPPGCVRRAGEEGQYVLDQSCPAPLEWEFLMDGVGFCVEPHKGTVVPYVGSALMGFLRGQGIRTSVRTVHRTRYDTRCAVFVVAWFT